MTTQAVSDQTQTLLAELDELAKNWRHEATELARDGMRSDADAIRQCRAELMRIVRLAKKRKS